MSDNPNRASWWHTLPGLLTGIAALITAIGGIVIGLSQRGPAERETDSGSNEPTVQVVVQNGAATTTQAGSPQDQTSIANPNATNVRETSTSVQNQDTLSVGHLNFKLLSVSAEPYATDANGRAQKLSLRVNLRITETMGVSDYIDRQTIRLASDGAELLPENSVNVAIYDRQSQEVEVLFVVPADTTSLELLLGRPQDATGRMPLSLQSLRPDA